jgi:probable HAF family extracellular repeat protein
MSNQTKWVRTGLILILAAVLLSGGLAMAKKPPKDPPPLPVTYSVSWLAPLPGHDSCVARNLNENGVVAGESYIEGTTESSRGFISYINGAGVRVSEDLNDIFADPALVNEFDASYVILSARDINNKGQIVGCAGIPSVGYESQRAYRYSPSRQDGDVTVPPMLENIGLLDADTGVSSFAIGVNEMGEVVGDTSDAIMGRRGFFYSDTHGMQDIGDLGGSVNTQSINDYSQIVGWDRHPTEGPTAFIYTPETGINPIIQTAPGDPAIGIFAYDINDLGFAVGTAEFTRALNRKKTRTSINPSCYDSLYGQVDDLDATLGLPGKPYGINNFGDMVGWAYSDLPWVYFSDFGLLNLYDLTDGGLVVDGVSVIPKRINGNAEIIGNTYYSYTTDRSFLLTPVWP